MRIKGKLIWRSLKTDKVSIAKGGAAFYGILSNCLGVVGLAYSGLSFKTPGKPVNVFGINIETTETHFIPPVVGALALVGGTFLLLVNPKRTT